MKQDIGMYEISNTDDIFKDAQNIVEQTRNYAYQAVNIAMIIPIVSKKSKFPLK